MSDQSSGKGYSSSNLFTETFTLSSGQSSNGSTRGSNSMGTKKRIDSQNGESKSSRSLGDGKEDELGKFKVSRPMKVVGKTGSPDPTSMTCHDEKGHSNSSVNGHFVSSDDSNSAGVKSAKIKSPAPFSYSGKELKLISLSKPEIMKLYSGLPVKIYGKHLAENIDEISCHDDSSLNCLEEGPITSSSEDLEEGPITSFDHSSLDDLEEGPITPSFDHSSLEELEEGPITSLSHETSEDSETATLLELPLHQAAEEHPVQHPAQGVSGQIDLKVSGEKSPVQPPRHSLRAPVRSDVKKLKSFELLTAGVKYLIAFNYPELASEIVDSSYPLVMLLQECFKTYRFQIEALREKIIELESELAEVQRANAARYQALVEEHKGRLSQLISDHEQQLKASIERAMNSRRQTAGLQVQLASAVSRTKELEDLNEKLVGGTLNDVLQKAESLKNENGKLYSMLNEFESRLRYKDDELRQANERIANFNNIKKNESALERDYMEQLESELASERALVNTMKLEVQQERQRNQKLWNKTKDEAECVAVLKARLESSCQEINHKNRLLETLRQEILQKIALSVPEVLLQTPQLSNPDTSIATWMASMKQAINTKSLAIQDVSKELALKEMKVSELTEKLRDKNNKIKTLEDDLKSVEASLQEKFNELKRKCEKVERINQEVKEVEGLLARLVPKAAEKNKHLDSLMEELKKRDNKASAIANKAKQEKEKTKKLQSSIRVSEDEVKRLSSALNGVKQKEHEITEKILVKQSQVNHLTQLLESKLNLSAQLEREVESSNTYIKQLIDATVPNIPVTPIRPNVLNLTYNPALAPPDFSPDNLSYRQPLNSSFASDHFRKDAATDVPLLPVQGQTFRKDDGHPKMHDLLPSHSKRPHNIRPPKRFELDSGVRLATPSKDIPLRFTQNTSLISPVSSIPPNSSVSEVLSSAEENIPPFNVISIAAEKSVGVKKKLFPGAKETRTAATNTSGNEPGTSGTAPQAIPYLSQPTQVTFKSSQPVTKTFLLQQPGRKSPLMVNVHFQPPSMSDTESREERFHCNVAVDCTPLHREAGPDSGVPTSPSTSSGQHGHSSSSGEANPKKKATIPLHSTTPKFKVSAQQVAHQAQAAAQRKHSGGTPKRQPREAGSFAFVPNIAEERMPVEGVEQP